jgi:hypothetical protein
MAEDTARHEKTNSPSGVSPIVFSAVTETHDTAMVATDHDSMKRSPFGGVAASGVTGE